MEVQIDNNAGKKNVTKNNQKESVTRNPLTPSNPMKEKEMITRINTNTYFNANNNIGDNFPRVRNLLLGYIEANYIEKSSLRIKSIRSIGFLVETYLVLAPRHKFEDEILNNPTFKAKFIPSEENFSKDTSEVIEARCDEEDGKSINAKNEISASISGLALDNSSESGNENGKNASKTHNAENTNNSWILLVLDSPIGELLFELNYTEHSFFSTIDGFSSRKKSKYYYTSYFFNKKREDLETVSFNLDNKVLYVGGKFYIFVVSNSNFMNSDSDGIIYTKKKKIAGFYKGNKSRVLNYFQMESLVENRDSESLKQSFNALVKNQIANNFKENEFRFLEVDELKETEILSYRITFDCLKKKYNPEIGILNFNSTNYAQFKSYFDSWEKMKTLFMLGVNLINKLANRFKINPKTLEKQLLMKKLIYTHNEENPTDFLDLRDFNFDSPYLSIVLNSYMKFRNIFALDLSGEIFNFEKAMVLSQFLFENVGICRLILTRIEISYSGLFYIVNSIRQSGTKCFEALNLGNSRFYYSKEGHDSGTVGEGIFNYLEYETPSDLTFLNMLFEIPSFKDLYLYNTAMRGKDVVNLLNPENKNRLRVLNLSENTLRGDFVNFISELIATSETLEELYLSKCDIDDFTLAKLLPTGKNKNSGKFSLKLLDLANNRISWKGADSIKEFMKNIGIEADCLEHNQSQSQSYCQSDYYNNESEEIESHSISNYNPNYFNNDHNNIYRFSHKSTYFNNNNSNCKTFTLILNNNTLIKSEGVSKICEAFSKFSHGVRLFFNNVGVNSYGLEGFYNLLVTECPIDTLSLCGNNIDDSMLELSQLNKALENSKCKLNVLYIYNNKITIEGVYSLVKNLNPDKSKLKIVCDPFILKKTSNLLNESQVIEGTVENQTVSKKNINFNKSNTLNTNSGFSNKSLDSLRKYEICFKFVEFCGKMNNGSKKKKKDKII